MRRVLILVALLVSVAGPARADEAKARALSERGLALYDVGDYRAAIDLFKEAYLIARTPGLLYNIAQAHRLLGECANALGVYKSYLRAEPSSALRAKVEVRIREMEACAARAPGEPTKEPPVEPKPEPVAPKQEPVVPSVIPPAPVVTPPVTPPAPIAAPRAPEPDPRRRRGLALLATGVALAAGGAILVGLAGHAGSQATRAADETSALYASGGTWTPERATAESDGRAASTRAIAFGVSGGAALLAGVALAIGGGASLRSRPAVAFSGSGVVLAWRLP